MGLGFFFFQLTKGTIMFKKFARGHKSQIVLTMLGAVCVALVDRHYRQNYICVACGNAMIADEFAVRNGNFQTPDGFYDVFQFEKL